MQEPRESEIDSVWNFYMKFDAKQAFGCKKTRLVFAIAYIRLLNIFSDTLSNIA